jgi:hypothetical protein
MKREGMAAGKNPKTPESAGLTPAKAKAEARLAAALRENLKRRKAQAKARAVAPAPGNSGKSGPESD